VRVLNTDGHRRVPAEIHWVIGQLSQPCERVYMHHVGSDQEGFIRFYQDEVAQYCSHDRNPLSFIRLLTIWPSSQGELDAFNMRAKAAFLSDAIGKNGSSS
jgi:hypothetical protein